jgi:diguanylate cyclase (GGDEF)-like protein/PAS domain S-box-containing protein
VDSDGHDIYRAFFDADPDAMLVVDQEGRIVDANARVTALFGYDAAELIGQPLEILLPERYRAAHVAHRGEFNAHPTNRPMGLGLDLWGRRRDGTDFPVDVSLNPTKVGDAPVVLAAVRDMTRHRGIEHELRASERRFRMVFEDAPFGMALVDSGEHLRQVNDALCDLLEADARDLTTSTIAELTPPEDSARYSALLGDLFAGTLPRFEVEKRFLTASGHVVWAEVTFSALGVTEEEGLAILMVEDITDRKQAEAHLTHLATHDDLTGLANRSLLADRVRRAQGRATRSGQTFAVVFLDLDGFKRVNDEPGHDAGDAVLVAIGDRLTKAIRPGDTVARHGGDEFVLCCVDLGVGLAKARDAIEDIVARVLDAVAEPIDALGQSVTLTASAGISLALGGDATPAALVADADAAMYEAKRDGGGGTSFAKST